jgi:hypothetical protein
MTLPLVPTDSGNEKQHRAVIAGTVNELVKVRPPHDRTQAEAAAGVTPSDYRYPPGASLGYHVVRVGADITGDTACDVDIQRAIEAAQIIGVQNSSAGRDQGVDIYLPAGLYTIDNPITLPRSGTSRSYCIGIIGDGEATRIRPSSSFPTGRAVIEWEAATERVFHQRLRDFKIDMRTGLAHRAIHFELNDPTTTVFNGQPWGQEEIKELDIDVMIHGDNTSHEVLVDIEGKIKYSRIRIVADLAAGATPTYSTILLRANSEFIGTDGNPGDKADAIAGDNAGVNYSDVHLEAVNSRGGNARCFLGRLSACNVFNLTSATGSLDATSILALYGSANNVFHRMFMEGREEDPQIYLEQCYYNTFLNVHFGSPDGTPSTGIQMVECEDNVFFNHSSATGKPNFSSNGGYLVDLDANCARNKFIGFGGTAAFFSEINDLGTDNYFEYVREDTGLVTQTHHRADYCIGPWSQDNAAASQTDVELTGTRWIAPRAGRLTAVTVKSTEARTASTLTIKVFRNTGALYGATGSEVSSSFRAQLNATDTSLDVTLAANEYTFSAGDEIYPVILTGGTWAPTTADVRVWIEVQC